MKYQDFPISLKNLKQWCVWKYKDVGGRKTKIPFMVNGEHASSTDSKTWNDHTVVATYESRFDGIGFVFNGGVAGIDLDNCIKPDGTIKKWAEKIVNFFNSYTEYSPSKKGLHIFIKTEADFKGVKRDRITKSGEKEGMECYIRGRFFTVTGEVYKEQKTLKVIDSEDIKNWIKENFPPKEVIVEIQSQTQNVVPEDKKVLDVIRHSKQAKMFITLYDYGDFKSLGYPSQSEADLVLVSSLMFFFQNDKLRVDRAFRNSKLYRPKWERADYRNDTLEKAVRSEVMDWSKPLEEQTGEIEINIKSVLDSKEEIAKEVNRISFMPTGYRQLDINLSGGFASNDFILLTGEAKSGKTDVCLNIVRKMTQYNPLFLTLEDPIESQQARKKIKFNDEEKADYQVANFGNQKITLDLIVKTIEKSIKEKDTKIIFIDNLDWISDVRKSYADSVQVLQTLKNFCDKNNVCIVMVAHLTANKDGSPMGTKRPNPEKLKGGTHLYQVAVRVLSVWRETIKARGEMVKTGYTRLILSLDRWGNNDYETYLVFDRGHFREISKKEQEELLRKAKGKD